VPGGGREAPVVDRLDEDVQVVEVEPHALSFTFVDFGFPK
jgi:hypothetical protein